jgi:hypothetical protein
MSYWKDENVNDLRIGGVRLLLEKLTAGYVVKKMPFMGTGSSSPFSSCW